MMEETKVCMYVMDVRDVWIYVCLFGTSIIPEDQKNISRKNTKSSA